MTRPPLEPIRRPTLQEHIVIVTSLVFVLVCVGPMTLAGSLWGYLRLRFQDGIGVRIALTVAGAIGFYLVWFLWPRLGGVYVRVGQDVLGAHSDESRSVVPDLAVIWLSTIPLIPLGTVGIDMFRKVGKYLRQRTLAEQVADEEKWLAEHDASLSARARRAEQHAPAKKEGLLFLGPFIKGDVFLPVIGIKKSGGGLYLEERLLDQHLFVLGTTGAGKSETIKRLAHEIFTITERDLFLVDGKGEEELAQTIRALAFAHGRGNAPIFRLGSTRPGAIYDGFRGEPKDVYSRLVAMVGVAEAEANAQFYADINRNLLQLICYAPGGPPRNFEQVRERLTLPWLLTAWKEEARELATIRRLQERDLEGLAWRMLPLVREFGPLIRQEGFALEETGCAIFSLRTQSVSDTASRFLSFLVEDLKDFIGKRQQRPGVLIIDEFGAFGNHNIIALLSLARGFKLGVILATQDVASLGEAQMSRLILSNTRTKILMASDYPEEVAQLAGTIYQVESSVQHDSGEATGMGSARVQHAFKVDMNEAARLQPGEGFIIRQRYAAKLRISRVTNVPPAPEEEWQLLKKSATLAEVGTPVHQPTSAPVDVHVGEKLPKEEHSSPPAEQPYSGAIEL